MKNSDWEERKLIRWTIIETSRKYNYQCDKGINWDSYASWTKCITNSKKVLMKCLTYIWSQYEIILILFICIMNTESFTSWICKSCNDIIFYDFKTFLSFLLLKPKWMSCRILNSIMIIYPLIWEWCRLRNTLYDSLNWAWHRIYIYR
jgi:hypothetical protein